MIMRDSAGQHARCRDCGAPARLIDGLVWCGCEYPWNRREWRVRQQLPGAARLALDFGVAVLALVALALGVGEDE
jgi:hypothetical protein